MDSFSYVQSNISHDSSNASSPNIASTSKDLGNIEAHINNLQFTAPGNLANTLVQLPQIYKAVHQNILETANKELVEVARRSEPSVLRNRSYYGLSESTWMNEILTEMSTRCPTVWSLLSTLLDYPANPQKKLPPMCLIYAIMMFMRCHELSRIQRINSIILIHGQADINVSSYPDNL